MDITCELPRYQRRRAAVYALRDGKVDAGSVRTGTLERMELEGKIRLEDFHVLEHDHIGEEVCEFPFLHSTDVYPEWPLAQLAHTSDELAEKVAVALIGMPADSPVAEAARCAGWTIPLNYQSVHECLKELRAGPYQHLGEILPGAENVERRHSERSAESPSARGKMLRFAQHDVQPFPLWLVVAKPQPGGCRRSFRTRRQETLGCRGCWKGVSVENIGHSDVCVHSNGRVIPLQPIKPRDVPRLPYEECARAVLLCNMTGQREGRPRIRCRLGFTLIELVTVVAIIAILAAIAVPRFGNSIARQHAESAAKRVAADLDLARRHAIQVSASQTVTFSVESNSYVLAGLRHLDHPESAYKVDLSAEPYIATILSADFDGDAEVVFDIYGTPDSGGEVMVRAGDWVKTISVEVETGKVTVD